MSVERIAQELTEMKSAGPNSEKGKCPFHTERTPSFYVFYRSQQWRCFGACNDGGDVIDLLRRTGQLERYRRHLP